MKKFFSIVAMILLLITTMGTLSGCSSKETVVIYTNLEDYRIAKFEECVAEEFPELNVIVQYMSTGTLAEKVSAEGTSTQADIIWGIDEARTKGLEEYFATLDEEIYHAEDKYLEGLVPSSHKYHVWSKEAGCVVINKAFFNEKGWEIPTSISFADLLDSKYRLEDGNHNVIESYIEMAHPASSGTGYFFYNAYVATYGKEEAVEYFTELDKNIKQYTSSGSGPVKDIDRGEIAIALGMTFQAVDYVKNNPDLEILFLDEGSPYSLYTSCIINGRETNENVAKVYKYMYDTFFALDKQLYNPELIYKNQTITKEGYPTDITYAQMINMDSATYKQELLDVWPN